MGEIGRSEDEPTPFFIDSQSAVGVALNLVFHKKSKHREITYHWIRGHVGTGGRGTARLVHVESMDQAPHLFTKVLCGPIFEALANVVLGLRREVGNYD